MPKPTSGTELYINRINAVIDYIDTHLEEKLNLDELSRVAQFSKYHFHRIFSAFMGESLYAFITRLRVERAAALLPSRRASITDIAFSLGFDDSATFARAFKKRFGISAGRWTQKQHSKINQAARAFPEYHELILNTGNRGIESSEIEEYQLPETELLYLRYRGPYAGDYRLFDRLHRRLLEELRAQAVEWNEERGFYVLYHDPLGITADEQLRISYGVPVMGTKAVSGNLGQLTVAAHRYLLCRFSLAHDEYGRAWTTVYRDILPQRGLQPVDGYCFEHYYADCYDSATGKTAVCIGVPVEPVPEKEY